MHLAVLRNDADLVGGRTTVMAVAAAGAAVTPVSAPVGSQRRTKLRSRLTSFVGREEEITRIGQLLPTSRLVTLVGPGGAGKTRLAGEATARWLDADGDARVADGVWLVELAPVIDPPELPQAILIALEQREPRILRSEQQTAPVRNALIRVVEGLAGQQLVIVLDNCEHLVDAAARATEELPEHVPGLRIVATSREPLAIGGESQFPVLPLAQPAADDSFDRGSALAFPAVRLFADRAAAARPDFVVDPSNVAAVVKICRRLDGLPLAIELAAAARLDDKFRLLTGGSRTAMPRHQTLRAVAAWSWEHRTGLMSRRVFGLSWATRSSRFASKPDALRGARKAWLFLRTTCIDTGSDT